MKKMPKLSSVYMLLVAAVFAVSCSSDDDKYNSVSPKFSEITFTPSDIYPGELITATAVQYKKGKLINRSSYSWSISGTTEDLNVSGNRSLFYDNDKSNPTCTFTAPSTPGTYTIEFNGEYNASGQFKPTGDSVYIASGNISYMTGLYKSYVTVKKRFRVLNR